MFRSLQPILTALALATMVAACTGTAGAPSVASLDDPSASDAPAPSASAVTPQDAALAYARCMRENGIDMPDPVVSTDGDGGISINQAAGGDSPTKEAFVAAEEACKHHMAAMRQGGEGPSISAEDLDKMLAFAQCMREHGIPMEDPSADGGIRIEVNSNGSSSNGSGGNGPPVNDAEMQAAHEACGSLLPGKMGQPGVTTENPKPGSGSNIAPDPAGSN